MYLCDMSNSGENQRKVAEFLLRIKAIQLSPENPFTWASGWKSPIYCDNRIALSYPKVRSFLCDSLAKTIKQEFSDNFIIAGVATGAIGIGILVAQELDLPFIYVRPEVKKHGQKNQIEGVLNYGQKVLVIEDLISTGKSSLNAVKALKSSGAEILGMMALFTYGFSLPFDEFERENIKLKTLSDYKHLLDEALQSGKISTEQAENLKLWRKDPSNWE